MNVSVVMATYNGEKYIRKQIESIVAQMSIFDELIISDDGSKDRTVEIVKEYCIKDNRIKFLNGPQQGVVKNFEFLINQANNEIIMLADQDDIWFINKFKSILNLFCDDKDILLVYHNMYFADNKDIANNNLKVKLTDIRKFKHGVLCNLIKSAYYGCGMCFRKQLKELILPFPDNTPMHDQWIACIAESKGKCVFLEEPLIIHRIHHSNVSQNLSISNKIRIRLTMTKIVTKKILGYYK